MFEILYIFVCSDSNGPPLSTKQVRSITILREIPFVVPFNTRVGIFQGLLAADRLRFVPYTILKSNLILLVLFFVSIFRAQGDQQGFLQGPSIQLVVRRSHLYEDAFDKLRPENGSSVMNILQNKSKQIQTTKLKKKLNF